MGNGHFHLISESLLREIKRKQQIIFRIPEYGLWKSKTNSYFQSESIRHSVSLELDGFEKGSGFECKEKAIERKFNEDCLKNAFDFGISNYLEYLSANYIEEIGRRIDPRKRVGKNKKNAEGFRGDRDFVIIKGAPYEPVSPQILEREINFFGLENSLISEGLEKAVHAQFHLIRIHPCNDGNGRLSRAITNIILKKNGFLPISIPLKEKRTYASFINQAAKVYISRESPRPPEIARYYEIILEGGKRHGFNQVTARSYRNLITSVVKNRMTCFETEFYDYLALKIRDSLNRTFELLSNPLRSAYRGATPLDRLKEQFKSERNYY